MTDILSSDVLFGQVGEPSYTLKSRCWQWPRQNTAIALEWIDGSRDAIYPSNAVSVGHEIKPEASINGRMLRRLVRIHPILGAAASSLPMILQAETEAVAPEPHGEYFADLGSLLGLGYAKCKPFGLQIQDSLLPIMAFPDPVQPGFLCLMILKPSQFLLKTSNINIFGRLKVPEIMKADISKWNSGDGEILQICFAESSKVDASLLAIRTKRSIAILCPTYEQTSGTNYNSSNMKDSKGYSINPNCIHQMPLHQQGETCHDMSFNPWNQYQFGTIGSEGTWTIWSLKNLITNEIHDDQPQPLFSGNTKGESGDSQDGQFMATANGRCRLVWTDNGRIIATVRNGNLSLFNITNSSTALQASGFNLGMDFSLFHLLDLMLDPSDNSRLFLLTSQRVFLVTFSIDPEAASSQVSASIVLSWRHHRASEERELVLSCFTQPTGMIAMIHSRGNSLVTVCELYNLKKDQPKPKISNPVLLKWSSTDLKLTGSVSPREDVISDILILPLQFEHNNNEDCSEKRGRASQDVEGLRFYNLILRTDNGAIITNLFCSVNRTHNTPELGLNAGRIDEKRIVPKARPHKSLPLDGFIAHTIESAEVLQPAATGGAEANGAFKKSSGAITASWESFYTKIVTNIANQSEDLNLLLRSSSNFTKTPDFTPLKTLQEIIASFNLVDVWTTSDSIRKLITRVRFAEPGNNDTDIHRLAQSFTLWLGQTSRDLTDLITVHNFISSHWVGSGLKNTSGANLARLQQLAREVAGEVCLSSIGVRKFNLQVERDVKTEDDGKVSKPKTPFEEMPSISHLRQYIQIGEEGSSITPPLERVMAHWDVGSDPGLYNYGETSASLSKTTAESSKHEMGLERPESRAKRQKMGHVASSQPTIQVAWHSSQTADIGSSQASLVESQAPVATASQPERGKNASRVVTKKAKNRKAGF